MQHFELEWASSENLYRDSLSGRHLEIGQSGHEVVQLLRGGGGSEALARAGSTLGGSGMGGDGIWRLAANLLLHFRQLVHEIGHGRPAGCQVHLVRLCTHKSMRSCFQYTSKPSI